MGPDEPTRKLFQLLKQAIPEIPDNVTRMSLVLNKDSCPVITYDVIVTNLTGTVTTARTFILTGIEPVIKNVLTD